MENITAVFSDWAQMESAASMLQEQGAIDIKLQEQGGNPNSEAESIDGSLTNGTVQSVSRFTMHVVIESSRLRQAEDTIARYGGQSDGAGQSEVIG